MEGTRLGRLLSVMADCKHWGERREKIFMRCTAATAQLPPDRRRKKLGDNPGSSSRTGGFLIDQMGNLQEADAFHHEIRGQSVHKALKPLTDW